MTSFAFILGVCAGDRRRRRRDAPHAGDRRLFGMLGVTLFGIFF